MNTTDLPTYAADILRAMPGRGGGLHRWLMRAAIALRSCGRDTNVIIRTLEIMTAGEPVKPGEIRQAAERSAERMNAIRTGGTLTRSTPWPECDEKARAKIIAEADGYGAVDLWEDSPIRCTSDQPIAETVIDALFPADALLCVAKTNNTAITVRRASFKGKLSELQFIVPSAMSAPTGLNQDGEESARCLNNTGPRQYLVIEQDAGTFDEQAAIIANLAKWAPLVLAVGSGKKSLHAWFRCKGADEARQRQFFASAVRLGADPATWTRCQLVRMPDGFRPDTKTRQHVLFFAGAQQ